MNDKKENINSILLVGFGGSGLRSLEEFDKVIASNPALWEHRRNDIYYLAVDTDENALSSFEESVVSRNNGGGVRSSEVQKEERIGPFVTLINLARGVSSLDEITHSILDPLHGRPGDPGLARLREHWWFDADNRPYSGPLTSQGNLRPLDAYGMTWYGMKEIGEKICKTIDDILQKRDGKAVKNLQVFFVTSLIGGTGRGSWAPVMFKIKEVFHVRYGIMVHTTGIFLKEGVSELNSDIFDPYLRHIHRINSVTGLSELSAWMANDQGAQAVSVQLPDMKFPADTSADVLKNDGDYPRNGTPVDIVYLICLRMPAQLVGRGLYALLECTPIQANHLNGTGKYNTFGVYTFGVYVEGLREYFNYLARESVMDKLVSDSDKVEERVEKFLKRIFLHVPVRGRGDVSPDENGTLMQRACAKLLSCCKSRISDIREKLRVSRSKGDCAEVRAMVQELLEFASATRNIDNAVMSAVLSVDTNTFDPQKELAHEVQLVYKGDAGEHPSLGRLLKFLRRLADRIAESESLSINEFLLDDPLDPTCHGISPREWIDRYIQLFSKRTFREVVTGSKLFNSDEVLMFIDGEEETSWVGFVPDAVLLEAYPKLRDRFAKFFEPLRSLVREMIFACERLLSVCHDVRDLLRKGMCHKVGVKSDGDVFKMLFVTPDRIENDLNRYGDRLTPRRRILKPIVDGRQELRGLLQASGKVCLKEGLLKFILDTLGIAENDQTQNIMSLGADKRSRLATDLFASFIRNVSVDDSFIEQEFSLYKVIERNREYWNGRLKKPTDDEMAFLSLCCKLRDAFGVWPERGIDGICELLSAKELLAGMLSSFDSYSAEPYWRLDREASRVTTAYVIAPLPESEESFVHSDLESSGEKFKRFLGDRYSRRIVYLEEGQRGVPADPFSVLVFTEEYLKESKGEKGHPFDKINPLTLGWKSERSPFAVLWKYPDTLKLLRKTEQPDGGLIFSNNPDLRGLGYISPRFVCDPQLSDRRWKPWMRTEDDEGDSDQELDNTSKE